MQSQNGNNIIDEYIKTLDKPSVNNSKEIMRQNLERLSKMGSNGAHIAQTKYGLDLDLITGYDDGEDLSKTQDDNI